MKKRLIALGLLFSFHAHAQSMNGNMAHMNHNQAPDTSQLDPKIVKPYSSNDPAVLEARKAVVQKLYDGLIHPNPKAVLGGTENIDDIFEHQVIQGRVVPAGAYNNFTSAMEYFYALAETPLQWIDKVTFKTLMAEGDKVALRVDLHFCKSPFTDCQPDVPNSAQGVTLTEEGFFTFNELNRIISFDLIIPNLGAAFDPPENDKKTRDTNILQLCVALTVVNQNPLTGDAIKGGTCNSYFATPDKFPTADQSKYGTNAFINCVTFMHTIAYGSWNRANSNTFTCRQLHTLLTPYRPDEHCPHTSPDGGGTCIDFPYDDYYKTDF